MPKSKCCVSKDRCKRCPIRMLKEGTLPDGLYGQEAQAGQGGRQEGPPRRSCRSRLTAATEEDPRARSPLRRAAQRPDRQRAGRPPPVPRLRGLLRRPDDAADGRVLLRPGARGARPRDDDGPVPPRHRRRGDHPRRRGAGPDVRRRRRARSTLALAQEKRVTEQINGLLRIAREESDFASEQFMQWFIKEQVEEVATMSDLLAVVTPQPRRHRGHRGVRRPRAERRGRRPDRAADRRRLTERPRRDAGYGRLPRMARVIVVGAGVVGLSCAVRLLEAGHRVDVLARDLPLETTVRGRGGDLVPLPGAPAGPGHRLVGARRTPCSSALADDEPGHRGADARRAPRCSPSRSADPWWRAAVPVAGPRDRAAGRLRRRLDVRDAGRRDAGLPALADRPGRGARRHPHPDEPRGRCPTAPTLVVNCSGLGARLLGRRPHGGAGARSGGRTSSRSAWTAGGSTPPGRRTSCRARATSSSAAPTTRASGAGPRPRRRRAAILARAARLVPELRGREGAAAQGRAAAGAARRTPRARGRRGALLRPRRRRASR